MARIFLAVPAYGPLVPHAFLGLHAASHDHEFAVVLGGGSLLANSFNDLFCAAYNWNLDHAADGQAFDRFGMHHSDVQAPEGFLDVLEEERERVKADVLSVVIPLKDDRGVTSTGWQTEPSTIVQRLTLTEVHQQLPETFCDEDLPHHIPRLAGQPKPVLMINTGLWLAKWGPWVEKFPGFQIKDWLGKVKETGKRVAVCHSEDWNFSGWCHREGLKVYATRKVPVSHWGTAAFPSDKVWGLPTDPLDGKGN